MCINILHDESLKKHEVMPHLLCNFSSEKPEEVESEADSASDNHNQDEYPAGTKLKVKYGRGRNQKIYEAKASSLS